ncbi:recombination regulator RecX [soil metagenome]
MSPDFSQKDNFTRGEQIPAELPLTITSISPQKKNGDCFFLFNDKTFLIGVSSQSLLDFSIQKGTILSRELFQKISLAEEYQKARDRGYLLLSGRDHGAEELRRKLIKKGISPEISGQVIEEFHQKNLLNDHAYARKFSQDKHHLKQWGARKIKAALYNKGVSKNVVEMAVQELDDEINQVNVCLELALKRRKHFLRETDIYKRKQKIFRYLAGKGYSPGDIQESIPLILKHLDA